jgi:cytidylate kinase
MAEKKKLTVAIDGPAASGKTTLALHLAQALGYLYFDTGVMYRAVTLAALDRVVDLNDQEALTRLAQTVKIDVQPPSIEDGRPADVYLDGRDVTWDIRSPQVEAAVSQVSAHAGVRQALTAQQRRIGLRGAVVMVGRDIGTVVLPEADLKIYLDASVEERARRRYEETQLRSEQVSYESILEGMRRRDEIDSNRDVAPLKPAQDAVILNTEDMDQQQVLETAKNLFDRLPA